ncbi:MAG: uracil phosphoribosyltransferase [Chitinophagaceae bacterium]
MVHNLTEQYSIISDWMAELRDTRMQKDRTRFRNNIERLGKIIGYEISKILPHKLNTIQTPLAKMEISMLKEQPILATILRAGLSLHEGLLHVFDKADNTFISAYRTQEKDGTFKITIDYLSSPSITNKTLIISDPMLATGLSMAQTLESLVAQKGTPDHIHIVCLIAAKKGIKCIQKYFPKATIWCANIDEKLNKEGYIVPGLGDAGDLAYGSRI